MSLNEGYRNQKLSNTQRQGIITCLPKRNKPKNLLKNWRPITLLNIVYKIASGCIANRIKTALNLIVNEDQSVFYQGGL